MLAALPVPAFSDNYIWLIRGLTDPQRVAIVDPGEAAPVEKALAHQASNLGLEKRVNPFLRWDKTGVIAAANRRAGENLNAADDVFAAIRDWKDAF